MRNRGGDVPPSLTHSNVHSRTLALLPASGSAVTAEKEGMTLFALEVGSSVASKVLLNGVAAGGGDIGPLLHTATLLLTPDDRTPTR